MHNHAADPLLTDQQWARIAEQIMNGVGLAQRGDLDAVRWVAIRHSDNHIHIVATLVRQDGRTAWAWHDGLNVQGACRRLEQRYGLHRVGLDGPRPRYPSHAELNKAARQHRVELPRHRLRHEVRLAAGAAANEDHFFDLIRASGLVIRQRLNRLDEVTGYAVGMPDHHAAAGGTIWYGGGRLAPDLALPKLRHRWRAAQTRQSLNQDRGLDYIHDLVRRKRILDG